MAVIKFGSIVTDGRGSLGGSTIQSDRSGHIWRNKPLPLKSRSQAQSLIRSYNKAMQAGWRALSELQKKIWNDYPKINHIFNKSGEKHPLSGHSLWMKYQFSYLDAGFALQTNVSKAAVGPFGPELITNGGFDDTTDWAVSPQWNILGGTANYLDTGTNPIRQYLIIPTGSPIRVKFDISNAPIEAIIGFLDSINAWIFPAPYKFYNTLNNGSYSWDLITQFETNRLNIWGNAGGSVFSLDNLSIKLILS